MGRGVEDGKAGKLSKVLKVRIISRMSFYGSG